jgi:multiple sugar transport system substrate-binding protein
MRRSIPCTVATLVAATALLTSACSSNSSTDSTGTSGGKVTLTFWSWVPNMDKIVNVWNKQNPNIQVHYFKVAQGDPAATKLLTAIKAGSGAPDVTLAEYQTMPEFVSANALADISKYEPTNLKSKFSAGDWSASTLGTSALYGVPEDSGPMELYYRKDVFDKLHLTAPKTWAEYAADAKTIHDANSNQYLGTFSSADAGEFAGLTQQAGASWWSTSGQTWKVDIDSPAAQKVAGFWGGLVQSGVIDNQPQYTPQWNKDLNDGSQVGWISAAWAPGVLAGNAQDTAGKWTVAPLPQWSSTTSATGDWGGSVNAVSSQSKHPAEAAKFVTWLDAEPGGVAQLVKQGGLYPSDTIDSAAYLKAPPPFFKNVPDFYAQIAAINKTVRPFTYGPNVDTAYSAFNDDFGKAAQAKSQAQFLSALSAMQSTTIADLKQKGFKVSD